MDITGKGVNFEYVTFVIDGVSRDRYEGNVRVHQDAHALRANGGGFRGRIDVVDSRGKGARTSSTGRRGPYACWHAYRDVMSAIFDVYPDATIATGMARYKGREGFESLYPGTAYQNIGSMMAPAYMPDLCECGY